MARLIHARNTENGLRFKIWSTGSDSYITEEMTEKEVREWTLKEAVCQAIEQHSLEIDDRIERTSKNGTSLRLGDVYDLNAPWDEDRD